MNNFLIAPKNKPKCRFSYRVSLFSNSLAAIFLWSLYLSLWLSVSPLHAEEAFPAENLRIVAVIDGSDELHLSPTGAKWVHKSWSYPTDVQINGHQWNPQQSPVWSPNPEGSLVTKNLDLSGAVLHVLRGRGSVQLTRDANGLVIIFDDPDNGPDTYEVTVEFAQIISQNKAPAKLAGDLELRIRATIDGMDDIWFSKQEGVWTHTGWDPATSVSVNGKSWDVVKNPLLQLPISLMPEVMDLQKASLKKLLGRGTVTLEYRPERICLAFEDYPGGADVYEAVVKVPQFRDRSLVCVKGDISGALLGAALKIYRFPGGDEARTLLAGQRVFDATGQCLVALEPGQYQFEVLHQADSQTVIALKTDKINIAGATNIDLKAVRVKPGLFGPGNAKMSWDEISIRSFRPAGDVSWKAQPKSNAMVPELILSKGQSYKIHAFGHEGSNFVALWKNSSANDLPKITLNQDQWLECSFHWREGTPRAIQKGVVLQFPDGELEIPSAETARLFTNRRFFNIKYWLAFSGDRKAVFQPQGHVLYGKGPWELGFGGPLRPLASAAIMEDENLGRPDALRLWWEITLGDAQNNLLDAPASKINWVPTLGMKNGSAIPAAPLTPDAVQRLANLADSLVASATYTMETNGNVMVRPEPFVARRYQHFSTDVPPYRYWNTTAYLDKAERELNLIFFARQTTNDPNHHVQIKWWLNYGAIGGGTGITMPVTGYLECRDWFSHPWAIAHEMLHTVGLGHTHEMDRLDREVQEHMEYFRWQVADHPEYVPAEWSNLTHAAAEDANQFSK